MTASSVVKEDRFVVGGPHHVADSFKRFRQKLAGAQILDLQLVLTVAGGVGRIGEQVAVVARDKARTLKNLSPFASSFRSSNNLFFRVEAALLAAVDRILFPFTVRE